MIDDCYLCRLWRGAMIKQISENIDRFCWVHGSRYLYLPANAQGIGLSRHFARILHHGSPLRPVASSSIGSSRLIDHRLGHLSGSCACSRATRGRLHVLYPVTHVQSRDLCMRILVCTIALISDVSVVALI